DVMGGFSYSSDLSRFMQNVMQILEVNGSFLTVLQDVQQEPGTSKPFYDGYPFTTEIDNAAGSQVTVCSWLKSIGCAEVRCEMKEGWSLPIEAYEVRKVCEDVSVPALQSMSFAAGTPPQRGFRLEGLQRRPAAKPAKP